MKITTHVELTRAQELTLEAFKNVVVRGTLTDPTIVATFDTFQAQQIKVSIDSNGVVTDVKLSDKRT